MAASSERRRGDETTPFTARYALFAYSLSTEPTISMRQMSFSLTSRRRTMTSLTTSVTRHFEASFELMPSQPTHSDHPLNLLFLPSVQVRPKRNIRMAMQNEVSAYAACQKDERGLDKAVEDAKYRMKRYGVTPNLLVIPPQERIQRKNQPRATAQTITKSIASDLFLRCLFTDVALHGAGPRREDLIQGRWTSSPRRIRGRCRRF